MGRRSLFFWLIGNMKDYSKYQMYNYQMYKSLPQISYEFIEEGAGYNASTDILTDSTIWFNGYTFNIVKAMAPLRLKEILNQKGSINDEKFQDSDYILLFLIPQHCPPDLGQRRSELKFLLNVKGEVLPCVTNSPCDNCKLYSASVKYCTNCASDDLKGERKRKGKDKRNGHKGDISWPIQP